MKLLPRVYLDLFLFSTIINTFPQTNFHLTDVNDQTFAHDCLQISVLPISTKDSQEILSFCLTDDTLSKWPIQINPLDQIFTFADLRKQNITSQQLYQWSASIDLIEQYQFYLIYNQSSLSMNLFYNCSKPRFGSQCQYEFLYLPQLENLSTLEETILHLYKIEYKPTSLTCYMHLECNRGSKSICLDWTDICDGSIHCTNDQIDEKFCWQLLTNECNEDEHRCDNGQCISKQFLFDESYISECFDQSDNHRLMRSLTNELHYRPMISYEDVACINKESANLLISILVSSSCDLIRHELLKKLIISDKPTTLSSICYDAFYCIFYREEFRSRICQDICENDKCQLLISETCPNVIITPAAPLAFGHVYVGYFKQTNLYSYRRKPDLVCYDEQHCQNLQSNNITLFTYNNRTCRRIEDSPIKFSSSGRFISTLQEQIKSIRTYFRQCNIISYENIDNDTNPFMYRCKHTTQYIPIQYVCDRGSDCPDSDDENCTLIDGVCSPMESDLLHKCLLNNECISLFNFNDGTCDCPSDSNLEICEDETLSLCQQSPYHVCSTYGTNNIVSKIIIFSTICDGFQELLPIIIDGMNHTDETECEFWQCNNTYTRCDGYWNCLNGADEVDCNQNPLIKCPLNHHICVEPGTFDLICLPLVKANDRRIDCLGAIDEPIKCKFTDKYLHSHNFYCDAINNARCVYLTAVCHSNCINESADILCNLTNNFFYDCTVADSFNHSYLRQYFCSLPDNSLKVQLGYFALDESLTNQQPNKVPELKPIEQTFSYNFDCHRGYPLRFHFDPNRIICLCPLSYYGDYCQYQNQRVTLTLQFQTYADSRRTIFSIIVQLIDNTTQRIIHSSKKLTYVYIKHCETKFNFYLTYSTRPKPSNRTYSIHIDIYEKNNLAYRGSLFVPLKLPFLPMHRIASVLTIPRNNQSSKVTCRPCVHGQCIKYAENTSESTFCHCKPGWTGRDCSIPYNCTCALNLYCAGIEANGRSICICPLDRWGPRCLLSNTNLGCLNNGQYVLIDDDMVSEKKFFCICPQGFIGDRCELENTKIIVSFDTKIDLTLADSMLVHFIEMEKHNPVRNGSTFQSIPLYQNEITIRWSHPFHVVFTELSNKDYYLVDVEKNYNRSRTIYKTLSSSDRCGHMNEYVNSTIANFALIRRIKYYHVPCQKSISCFYDQDHFCLCQQFGSQRIANCFPFDTNLVHNCFKLSTCQNNGQCTQDDVHCPQTFRCACRNCSYGSLCQFKSSLFDLSLDGIIGYHIQPNVRLIHQPTIVKITLSFIIIIALVGIINGILCFIIFQSHETRKVGCGYYLYASTITSFLTSIMLILKFSILLQAQMGMITNRTFLNIQCYSFDYLLEVCLNMDRWLNGFVALERAFSVIKGIRFNQKKSVQIAKYAICCLTLVIIVSHIYDPIHRQLADDNSNENQERIWCIVSYSSQLLSFNQFIHMFHFFLPFILNIISPLIIVISATKRRRNLHTDQLLHQILYEQIHQNRHLLISPCILIILSLPRLIISFLAGCMQTNSSPWIYLIGYLVSFLPSMLLFVIFVLPSKLYRDEFNKSIKQCREGLQRLWSHFSCFSL